MFQEKIGVRSVRLAIGLLAALAAGQSIAQEAIQRVEITGTSIKRIVKEGALPVQIISKETIARTGATTVADVIQKLPAMQGFTIEAVAAGTNSGGRTTVSIHDLGSSYTLVLLNGRRMAPLQDSGSAVNLNSIPMSAIDHIEVLTDGASALYGADAIAGVVNFVLKKNYQGLTLDAGYVRPQHEGGTSSNFTATYGVGDLDTDRYNFLVTYRHDNQEQLKAPQRDFGKSAYIPFTFRGRDYIYDRTSVSTSPANVAMTYRAGSNVPANGFNPYFKANNKCADLNFLYLSNTAATEYCSFDFAAQVEIVPESKRDSAYASGSFKLGADTTLFADMALARFDLTARIASNPVDVTIPVGSSLYNQYVLPYLTPAQAAAATTATARYRAVDFGTRDSRTITDVKHLVTGIKGSAVAWDYDAAFTLSKYDIDERYTGGYMKNTEFRSMLTNRTFDPFASGGQSDATQQLINNSLFLGSIRTASSTLKGVDAHASREVFALPGGKSSVGIGADYRELQQVQSASQAAKDGTIYAFSAPAENDYTRDSAGAFVELFMPVLSNLELTAGARYDSYSKIKDALAKREVGNDQHAGTYKLALRYTPVDTVLLRGSYGTGFRVADQGSIASPVVAAGFTSASYVCPPALQAEDPSLCRAGKEQYNVYSGGNDQLSPEKSKQFTMGFRVDASKMFTFGADLWDVKMSNQVSSVSEIQAFADPVKFRQLFSTFTNPATGLKTWAFLRAPINIGRSHSRGIDWDATVTEKFGFGKLVVNANGTYLIKSEYTTPGTDNLWTNSMNKYGINDAVSFRNIARLTTSLETGSMVNSFSVNWRNGYTDAAANPYSVADKKNVAVAIRLKVPGYTTVDYQGKYVISKAWDVRFGIKNLMDEEPPLSLRTSSGHQVGYDPRYADTMGRTAYLNSSYKF
ncbi:MAG TPA: TonB-dependent receptor [Telluria sp.]|jgi:iron complex outermembrane receptor protein